MTAVKCHKCGYQTNTKSKRILITCSSCGAKVQNTNVKIKK